MWGRYSCCRNRLFFIFTAGRVEGFFEKRRFDYFFVDLLKIEHLDGRMKDEKFLSAAAKVTAWLRNQSQKYGGTGSTLMCASVCFCCVCRLCEYLLVELALVPALVQHQRELCVSYKCGEE